MRTPSTVSDPRICTRINANVPAGNLPPAVRSMVKLLFSSPKPIGTQPRPSWVWMSDSSPSRRASSVSTASARIGSVPDEPPVSECNGWSPGASYGRPYTGVSGTSDHHQVVNVADVVPHVADRRVRRPHRLDRVMLSDQLADGQRRADHVWGRLGDNRARDHKPVPDQSGRSLTAHLTHVHIAARHRFVRWHVDEQHSTHLQR